MGHGGRKIWIIPALIIGFNCIAFIIVLAVGINRDKARPADEAPVVSGEGIGSWTAETAKITDLDGSFYDEEGEEEPDRGSGYVLLLTSSESDLKIQMVDTDGSAASDMHWIARITRLEADGDDDEAGAIQAEDDDGDGIIYLDDVDPGAYSVAVEGGYGIVETSSITVKPRIRYTASAGIRNIVMQESDIDAAAEDTANSPEERENEARDPDGSTEDQGDIVLPQGTLGIDVSKYNKEIAWDRVRASGIEFAIIRAGYRGSSSGVLVEDPCFRQNLAGAKAAGISIGVYFFTQAVSTDEAKEEAGAVASLVNASDLALPVFLDVESSGNINGGRADPLDVASRTEIVRAFCETAESLGYKAGVYANKTWMTKKLDMQELAPYTKWLAQYRSAGPTYEGDYSIWQYTSGGQVDGINGRTDLDILIK